MKHFARLTAFATAILAVGTLSAATEKAPRVGDKAPNFTLTSAAGNTHSLSDFEGKFVVLEWVNHGCPFVKKHYSTGNMQATQKAAVDEGMVWLSICSSAPGKQGHMSAAAALAATKAAGVESTAYLLDEEGTVGKAYSATRTPEIFIINEQGTIVYHGAIDSIPSARGSDVERADNFVLAAFQNIAAGEAIARSATQPYGCSVKY
ncbi:MAG: redoxin family protein [Opitutales bacterium]